MTIDVSGMFLEMPDVYQSVAGDCPNFFKQSRLISE
jgi:hypothetical protein